MTSRPATKKGSEDGKTRVEQQGDSSPRLPHERDESADSQRTPDGAPPKVGRRAHNDVERGAVDTDRALGADRVYKDKGQDKPER